MKLVETDITNLHHIWWGFWVINFRKTVEHLLANVSFDNGTIKQAFLTVKPKISQCGPIILWYLFIFFMVALVIIVSNAHYYIFLLHIPWRFLWKNWDALNMPEKKSKMKNINNNNNNFSMVVPGSVGIWGK